MSIAPKLNYSFLIIRHFALDKQTKQIRESLPVILTLFFLELFFSLCTDALRVLWTNFFLTFSFSHWYESTLHWYRLREKKSNFFCFACCLLFKHLPGFPYSLFVRTNQIGKQNAQSKFNEISVFIMTKKIYKCKDLIAVFYSLNFLYEVRTLFWGQQKNEEKQIQHVSSGWNYAFNEIRFDANISIAIETKQPFKKNILIISISAIRKNIQKKTSDIFTL